MTARILSPLGIILIAVLTIGHAQSHPSAQQPPAGSAAKNPYLKLAEPWPEENVIRERKQRADARPLFAQATPLVFGLTANFRTIDKDHDPKSNAEYPGTMVVEGLNDATHRFPVTLSARGHFRRMARNCRVVPLKVEFSGKDVNGTVFDGQSSLKLGTGCERTDEYDQITLREYLTYELFNMVTPLSFRARLAKASYTQEKAEKPLATRYAIFIEHENDVARRASGRIVEIPRIDFKSLDAQSLTRMMLYEYMIGNTDFSIYALHNVVVVQMPDRTLWPVPYDFDMSGFVHAPYAIPDRRLPITAVTSRLYRGPCRTVEEFSKAAEPFRAKKTEMFARVAGMSDIAPDRRDEMRVFLDGFFKAIESPEAIKKEFVNGCKATETM